MRQIGKKAEKELAHRLRECINGERLHIKGRTRGGAVFLIGSARELHGTVCTCCPKRAPEGDAA